MTAKSRHSGLTGKGDQSRLFTKREGHRATTGTPQEVRFWCYSLSKCASGMSCFSSFLESYCRPSSVLHSGWRTKYSVEMLIKVPVMQNQKCPVAYLQLLIACFQPPPASIVQAMKDLVLQLWGYCGSPNHSTLQVMVTVVEDGEQCCPLSCSCTYSSTDITYYSRLFTKREGHRAATGTPQEVQLQLLH